jgi:hypothetical protein
MSRSYHVTEKKAKAAFYAGDSEPMYQASEKSWVKKQHKKARKTEAGSVNRAVVGIEKARTAKVKNPNQPVQPTSLRSAADR